MKYRTYWPVTLVLSLLAVFLVAAPASAQPQSNFVITAGWFPTSFSSKASFAAHDIERPGTPIDLEDDLGVDRNAQNFNIEGFWRFTPKQRLIFGYTSWRRTGEKTIDRPIDWGDAHFDVGGDIRLVNNAQFIKLAYRYSFIRTETTEFAGSVGFDTIWNKTTLKGTGTITGPNGNEATGAVDERNDFVAPAPVIGVSFDHLITPKWLVRASSEYFQLTVNDTTGKVLDFRVSGDYLFSPNYGVGLGYSWVGFKVERPRFDAQYDFSGPTLYFSYRR